MKTDDVEDVEIHLLLEGVQRIYGYDFRDYADASIKRRLTHWLAESGFETFSQAQAQLLRSRSVFESLLRGITVNVTEMFRDPAFFRAVREQVVPFLKTYPFVKIWHAGCATGEEAYSMAILLNEEGMAGRYRMYATDINEAVLQKASEGVMPIAEMQRCTRNYQKAGGRASFADYYTARYDRAMLTAALKKDIVFAPHNLAVDGEFGEMNLVLCRNVMIYFKPALKERCLRLFDSSLLPGGFLCLGLKETLERRKMGDRYEELAAPLRIYRKRYG
ncbi:MAG: chemotaxis protein methyltransferase CheR [Rhodocyclaceae bacterium]|nr:MAG: chemotaxis protein methyltransferase CheR [Rhodocyclaceae bacterium]TND00155.1 MAG: chemotaxis protein methyltransferase CheR [Rhodocyclaceae bacterium]